MRFFILASLSFLVLLVSAQTSQTSTKELLSELTKLPKCVTTCVTEALPRTKCSISDLACVCNDQAYAAYIEKCLLASCTIREALSAQTWQYKACPVEEHNAGPFTVRFAIALLVITTLCVGCRFLARWRIQNASIGIDDWTILACFILFIPATVLIIIMARNGMGRDIWTVDPDDITLMLKVFYICQFFYQVVVTLTKISIVLLYLRIFPKEVSRQFTYVCWAVIAGLVLYLLAFLLVFLLECRPISHFWNQWDGEHEGYCASIEVAAYFNGGFNILFDLIVFFLPIPKLMKLQVRDKRRKIGVIFTFLIGIFVTACSCVRLQYLAGVSKYSNATYYYNNVGFWTGLEAYMGMICACMPSILGPLMRFLRETIGSKLSSYYGSYGSSGRSRITQDKSITRLPSESAERPEEVELAQNAQKSGVTEKAGPKTFYNLPSEHSSNDEMDLVYHNTQREGKDRFGV